MKIRKILLLMTILFFACNVYAQDQEQKISKYFQSENIHENNQIIQKKPIDNYVDCYQQVYNNLSVLSKNSIDLNLNLNLETSSITFSKNPNDLNSLKGTYWGFIVTISGTPLKQLINIDKVVTTTSDGTVGLHCVDADGYKGAVFVVYNHGIGYGLKDPCFAMDIDIGSADIFYFFNLISGVADGISNVSYDDGRRAGPYEFFGVELSNPPDPDNDGDGYTVGEGDCNDSNKNINPGETEICTDRIDNDCDSKVDCNDTTDCGDDPACQICTDADGDGYYVESDCDGDVDCNDGKSSIHPGAFEIRDDGIDQDCDGKDDKEREIDDDKDGYTENQGDCNDYNSSIHPGAFEICGDGIDQNCDGIDGSCIPKAPTGLAANAVSSRKIMLRWTDKSSNEDGFKIERKKRGCNSSYEYTQIATVSGDNKYEDKNFEPDSQYSYRVKAYNSYGNSEYSNCGTTTASPSGTPSAPVNLVATYASSSRVDLTWDEWSSTVTEFEIYRKVGSGSWELLETLASTFTEYSDKMAYGNQSTTSYSYYVQACNNAGCSPPTYTVAMPFNPTNLTARAGSNGKSILEWTDNCNNERGFEIYRKSGSCSSSASWEKIKQAGISRETVTDGTATTGITYSYKIRAYCRSWGLPYVYGYSDWSNCDSIVVGGDNEQCADADGDGYYAESGCGTAVDCNDNDATIYPGALEACDGADNDCDGSVDEGCEFEGITVSGSINNLDDAEDCLSEDSYLQAVYFPPSHSIPFTTDAQGRYIWTSNLKTIDIPSTDSFVFEIDSLMPGEYIIAVQLMDAPHMSFLNNAGNKEITVFEIQAGYSTPLNINLGDSVITCD